jgi:hypothetical protein
MDKIIKIGFLFFLLNPLIALSSRCTGSTNCKACTTCSSCKFCSKKGGTCGVCDQSKSEKSSLLSHPASLFILGAGTLGGSLLLYKRIKK